MNIKQILRSTKVGHYKRAFLVLIIIIPLLGSAGVLYHYTFAQINAPEKRNIGISNDLNNNQDIAANEILKINQRKGGLWVENYIYINGKKYQLKYDQNGKLQVFKNNGFVDIEKAVNSKGAIVNKNGKMYYYTPEKGLVDLTSGDILTSNDKVVEIKNSKVNPLRSDNLIPKNNKLIYVDPITSNTHEIQDGEIIDLNNKAMKMTNGILKPLSSSSNNIKDGSLIAKSNNGEFKYFLKQNGQLIPVKSNTIDNGSKVFLDSKPLIFEDGDLFEKEQIDSGVLNQDDLKEVAVNDYIVKIGSAGKPIYFQKRKLKNVIVNRKEIPDYALVYFKNGIYQAKKEKLIKFKFDSGIPFIKSDKPFVLDSELFPLMLKATDMVKYNGELLLVSPQNRFVVLDDTVQDQLKKYGNRLIVDNGQKKLFNKGGNLSDLKNKSLIFRGGFPYLYIDGKLVRLTQKEFKELTQKKSKPKVVPDKKKTSHQTLSDQEQSITSKQNNPVSNLFPEKQNSEVYDPEQLVAISNSSMTPEGYSSSDTQSTSELKPIEQTNQTLDELAKIVNGEKSRQALKQSNYTSQNDQAAKEAFLKANKKSGIGHFEFAKSPYYLSAGSVIDATMQSGVNSDLPGNILAVVNTNVYDSISGNHLLIPAGTKIFGVYSSNISYGQKRVLMAWNKLIFPNGTTMDLAGQQGYDLTAQAGLKADVDNHYWSTFKDVALMSIFSAASQYAAGGTSGSLNALSFVAASIGQQLSQVGTQLVQKTMNIQPTLKIQQGTKFKILIDTQIYFKSPYKYQKALNFVLKE